MDDNDSKGWFADFADTYGAVRIWGIALLGPVLAISELLQGRVWVGLGLVFICVMAWTELATRHGVASPGLVRIGNAALVIGGILLAWHYGRWWVEYLR